MPEHTHDILQVITRMPYSMAIFLAVYSNQVIVQLLFQAQEQLGTCCLYTVIEWAREHLPRWLAQDAATAKESAQESPAKAEPAQHLEAKAQDDEVCRACARLHVGA